MKNRIVDIVIPTYRPGDKFRELITRLKKQDYPVRKILVVNTEAGAFPQEFCEKNEIQVIHIPKSEFDHGGTRDMAMQRSDAEIVVFMTQDAMPANSQLISNLVEGFSQDQVGAVYARQLPREDCSVIEKYTRKFNYPEESRIKDRTDIEEMGIKTFFCSNVCAAYRREIYERMGGFEKRTIFNEDMILAGKMVLSGYKIGYMADAKVIHSHNYSGMQQFHRNFDLAVSQAEHPEVFDGIRSESEGIRLVKQTALYLIKIKKPWLIVKLVYQSGCKYLGYKLGRGYERLPKWMIRICTMNQSYWDRDK